MTLDNSGVGVGYYGRSIRFVEGAA